MSLNYESFKLNKVNWLLGMPPGYAHDKKNFEILTVGDTSKNLSRASPSPPTGQLKNLGRDFAFILVCFVLLILVSWIYFPGNFQLYSVNDVI